MKLDLSKLNRKINAAFNDTVEAFAEQCQTEIETDQWNWPNTTERSDGSIAGTTRDIVDTGALLNSVEIIVDGDVGFVSYGVDYAVQVHEGEVTPSGKIKPGRPWTVAAAQNLDISQHMADELRRRL